MRTPLLLIVVGLILANTGDANAEPAWKRLAQKMSEKSAERGATDPTPVIEGREPADSDLEVQVAAFEDNYGPDGSLLPEPDAIGMAISGKNGGKSGTRINLGKESEEIGMRKDLFEDPKVLQMLGENPRFVYGTVERMDPMIFPPVRNAAIYMELKDEADALAEAGKFEEALELYTIILDLKDRRYVAEMRTIISEISATIGRQLAAAEVGEEITVELPLWVRDNTRGILFDPTQPMCLVGDFLLKAGENVPSYPEVVVAEITKQKVTFRVSDVESFEIDVKGYFDE